MYIANMGVVAILDFGERFWKPGSHWGRLRRRARPKAVLGWVREGSPSPAPLPPWVYRCITHEIVLTY